MTDSEKPDGSSEASTERRTETNGRDEDGSAMPMTREEWEDVPPDPDPTVNLGYSYDDWDQFETSDGSAQIMFLPADEEQIRDDAFVVADKDVVCNLGSKY